MSLIKTQAMKITEETYPVAMACLPPAFATIPLHKVLDNWLVTNEVMVNINPKTKERKLVVNNTWMPEHIFNETYSFMSDPSPKTGFIDVMRVSY